MLTALFPFGLIICVVALAFWLMDRRQAEDLKVFINCIGGFIAMMSGTLWVASANASIAATTFTDKLNILGGKLNLYAANCAFFAAVLLVVPYLIDTFGQKRP